MSLAFDLVDVLKIQTQCSSFQRQTTPLSSTDPSCQNEVSWAQRFQQSDTLMQTAMESLLCNFQEPFHFNRRGRLREILPYPHCSKESGRSGLSKATP